jgi:hypothetical protein
MVANSLPSTTNLPSHHHESVCPSLRRCTAAPGPGRARLSRAGHRSIVFATDRRRERPMGSFFFRRLFGLPLEVGRSAGNVFYVQAVKNAAGDIVERRTVGIDLGRSALALRTPDSHSRYALRPFARSNTTGSRALRNSWGKRQRYPQGGKCGYMGVAI